MVPFGVPIIVQHLLFRVPKIKWDPNFDNHPINISIYIYVCVCIYLTYTHTCIHIYIYA